ncbi:MAG TPA: hypothetical protein VIP70_00845 [Nitrososphaeraceae archaeon]
MIQKSLVVAAMLALIATVAIGTTTSLAFAQVTNEGVEEDDDTTNISSTPTKVKSAANCNESGFANECDNESESEIEAEE